MIKIKNIKIRNILNSAGKEALEVEIITDNNLRATASSPSAIIPGKREVMMTNNINEDRLNEMITEICNTEIVDQGNFDNILNSYMQDLGSNICLPFSLAAARLIAQSQNLTLVQYISNIANCNFKGVSPIPIVTIFSGGVHNQKQSGSIQNIMIAVDIHPFSKSIQAITEIYSYIENKLKERNILNAYGASSGMITQDLTVDEKFEMVENAIKN